MKDKEVITRIVEVTDVDHPSCGYSNMDGYEVETTHQKILVLISNSQSCCENWGYLSSFESPEEFIGSTLLKIEVAGESLVKEKWDSHVPYGLDEGGAMFINFETDRGTFQLTAYNGHNGYYAHKAVLISKQLTHNESI